MLIFMLILTGLLSSLSWSADIRDELSFITMKNQIAGQHITRATPVLNGIVVEGADEIFDETSQKISFLTHLAKPKNQLF